MEFKKNIILKSSSNQNSSKNLPINNNIHISNPSNTKNINVIKNNSNSNRLLSLKIIK